MVSAGDGDAFVPAAVGPAYGLGRLTAASDYGRDLLEAFAAQGIRVEQLHPEYAPGQFEVSVAAESPVHAADTSVLHQLVADARGPGAGSPASRRGGIDCAAAAPDARIPASAAKRNRGLRVNAFRVWVVRE